MGTLPETNSSHLKIGRAPPIIFIFQPSSFRCDLLVLGRVSVFKYCICIIPKHVNRVVSYHIMQLEIFILDLFRIVMDIVMA